MHSKNRLSSAVRLASAAGGDWRATRTTDNNYAGGNWPMRLRGHAGRGGSCHANQDRVIVVTGATSGIGRACVELFAKEGAQVVLAGRRRELGAAVAEAIGERAFFVASDVTREADIAALIEAAMTRFGRIDALINNAGAASTTGALADTEVEAFDNDWALHVRAAFLTMKYAAPHMIAVGGGSRP